MLDYVYGQDEIVADFVAQMIPHVRERGFGRCRAIGVLDGNGALIAGLVYHNWNPSAGIIEMSGAALPQRKWLTLETLYRMYAFPFEVCDCQMVMKLVPDGDERLLRELAVGGHALTRLPRIFGRDEDGVLCTLTVEDWLSNRIHQRARRHVDRAMKEAA